MPPHVENCTSAMRNTGHGPRVRMPQSHYLAKIFAFETTLDYPQMDPNLDSVLQGRNNTPLKRATSICQKTRRVHVKITRHLWITPMAQMPCCRDSMAEVLGTLRHFRASCDRGSPAHAASSPREYTPYKYCTLPCSKV